MLLRRAALLALLTVSLACSSPQTTGGQCTYNADCASGLVCAASFCRTPCAPGGTCPAGMRCEPVVGTSVTVCALAAEEPRCVYASDCPAPLVCNRDGRCRPECRVDYDCQVLNPFTTCDEGTCALRCVGANADCDGLVRNGCEVDTSRDASHCGACGTACRAGANQSMRCEQGTCIGTCRPGFADCDGNAGNGCEASLDAATSCGACTTRCEAPRSLCQTAPGGARSCVSQCGGATPMECAGRCVNPQTDVSHCGACGNACPAGPNATATCAAGRCGVTCAANFGDCDNDPTNGCETDLRVSPANCGMCGRACALMGATATCAAGACTIEACAEGFGNCDGNPGNGCEARLDTLANCRVCGAACGSANASPACGAEGCNLRCTAGFGDCDERSANGCETALDTLRDCRACGHVCGTANAAATGGQDGCALRCNQGFGNCDGDDSNGCETSLTANDLHCGACGNACAAQSAQTGVAHACGAGVCLPRNDTCAGAQVIDMTAATPFTVRASNRYARRERDAACTEGNSGDVWFRLTLTQRELVAVDTLGATWDTVLYLNTDCTTPLRVNVESSEVACSDDVGSRCDSPQGPSRVVAVLAPGTYYLVLTGAGVEAGEATLNVQHLALGNGPVEEYPLALGKPFYLHPSLGAASGLRGTCGGAGGEASYWWVQCPGQPGGRFYASACSEANAGFNSVLYLRHGDGAPESCNDDAAGTTCRSLPQSAVLDTSVRAGAGIHALTLDGFDAAPTTRSFELFTAFPYMGPE